MVFITTFFFTNERILKMAYGKGKKKKKGLYEVLIGLNYKGSHWGLLRLHGRVWAPGFGQIRIQGFGFWI